ncbi:Uncharacterised protein [uncultured archaeon]|nr:Uncharacterised protein [uncultured archaeon]
MASSQKLTFNDFKKDFIEKEKRKFPYIVKQKADRLISVLGWGNCSSAGIYGVNLMDDITAEYVEGHFAACVALCRSRTELVLREYIYFRWFLTNQRPVIENYLDKRLEKLYANGESHDYVKFGVKNENLVNRLIFELFEKIRPRVDATFLSLKYPSIGKYQKKIHKLALGDLLRMCKEKNYPIDDETYADLTFILENGNEIIHCHYFKASERIDLPLVKQSFLSKPEKICPEIIKRTSIISNCMFESYDSKIPSYHEKLYWISKKWETRLNLIPDSSH